MSDTAYNWVAKQKLSIEGQTAFAEGDFVPDEHVENYGWQDLVVPRFKKDGEQTAAAEKVGVKVQEKLAEKQA